MKTVSINLANHFTPGNVLFSDYWREYDKVVAFHPATETSSWAVEVIRCDRYGVPLSGEAVRNHSTRPDPRDRVVIAA